MNVNPVCASLSGINYDYKYGTFKVANASISFYYGGAKGSVGTGCSGSIHVTAQPKDQPVIFLKFDFDMGNVTRGVLRIDGVSTTGGVVPRGIGFEVDAPKLDGASGSEIIEAICRLMLGEYVEYWHPCGSFIPVPHDYKPETGLKVRECAFIWLHSKENLLCHKSEESVPFIMTFTRWDGKTGTIGGKVEEGETPVQAAIREAKEELSESFGDHELEVESNLHRLSTFLDVESGLLIHSFSMCLPYDRMIDLSTRFFNEKLRNKRELCGISFVPCANYYSPSNDKTIGIGTYLNNDFSATAKLELRSLIANIGCRSILRQK